MPDANIGDARFVETQTMKSDDLFVVGHRVFLLLLDYIFRCNSIIQGVSDRRRECMISAVNLSDLCGQSVRRRAVYSVSLSLNPIRLSAVFCFCQQVQILTAPNDEDYGLKLQFDWRR